ncbi:MAG: EF-hand domain-containing protein [Bradyrhizobium sp.]|uniref:EF-hand domain-containing protein n=1 Tax=Bradyrhizobium sp. TaxID=376 RepID=UPI003C7A0894
MQAQFRQRRQGNFCPPPARNAGTIYRPSRKNADISTAFALACGLRRAPRHISRRQLSGGIGRSSVMWFALGAASSIFDGLQSLGSSKSTSGQSGSGQASSLFDFLGGSNSNAATSTSTAASSGTSAGSQIAPQTMSALLSAQSDASSTSATASANASYTDPLQDLYAQIDGNSNGSISKSEFETALGAGGTNTAQADDVFSKMDKDGDGSVSMAEMKSALQGAGHHGHHHHVAASSEASSASADTASSSNSDALLQAISDSQDSASKNNGDGSTKPGTSNGLQNVTGLYQLAQLAHNQPTQNASAHSSSVSMTV